MVPPSFVWIMISLWMSRVMDMNDLRFSIDILTGKSKLKLCVFFWICLADFCTKIFRKIAEEIRLSIKRAHIFCTNMFNHVFQEFFSSVLQWLLHIRCKVSSIFYCFLFFDICINIVLDSKFVYQYIKIIYKYAWCGNSGCYYIHILIYLLLYSMVLKFNFERQVNKAV